MSEDAFRHYDVTIKPDPSRTIPRSFVPSYPEGFGPVDASRAQVIAARILELDEDDLAAEISGIFELLDERHNDVEDMLLRRCDALVAELGLADDVGHRQRLLIGAYFTQEYSFEAAALFNPSVVPHPDQSGVPAGAVRFIMSLRAIGEGHISSLSFRTGIWTPGGALELDAVGPTTQPPTIEQDAKGGPGVIKLHCGGTRVVSETVLFPMTASQKQGIEDVRLVRFVDDRGRATYYGTYTAFDGMTARSELLTTKDFHDFEARPLCGDAARGKGMALFPRKVDGQYAMLGRQDNENIWFLQSNDLSDWNGGVKAVEPRYPWEFVQMGNCGSPIEIDEGWLVFTHGVGKVRNYAMGACLLDRNDPSKLLARTPRPILAPAPDQRDGYVPNVVYSCGAVVLKRDLLLPYAVADSFTAFATGSIDALLSLME